MKKILACLMCVVLTAGIVACGDEEEQTYEYELAMIVEAEDVSIDDNGRTEAAWKGLQGFAEEKGLTYKYYEPAEDSTDGRLEQIDKAAQAGAKTIACVGEAFEEVVYTAQDKYEDIQFVLLDGYPAKNGKEKTGGNCIAVKFDAEQAGYLAGYAAVCEGYRDLAFMGQDNSKITTAYGYGFVQGANDASSDRGGYPTVKYELCDAGESAAKTQKRAEKLYKEGTEVIFVCGDDIFNSVAAEADIAGRKVIASGADRNSGKTVIASAVKNYGDVMQGQLEAIYHGSAASGRTETLGAKEKAVDLNMKKSEFVRFDREDYKNLYKKVKNKKLKQVEIKRSNFHAVDLLV